MTILIDPPAPEPRQQGKAASDKSWIVNGRYRLPDPDTGKPRTWTRVTNIAKTLEDTYNLQKWGERMVTRGMALRPDLAALASGADPDTDDGKSTLNRVAYQAKEFAGASRGANLGTALHSLTEQADAGIEVQPGNLAGELAAYQATMTARGWRVVPEYLERIICVPELGCAGRVDKLLEVAGRDRLMVGDLKTQKSMDFGKLGIAVQLAIYAHAYAVWDEDEEAWEEPPSLNKDEAAVLWAPIGRGLCEPYRVDLVEGWRWVLTSMDVRQARKADLVSPWPAEEPVVLDPPVARMVVPAEDSGVDLRIDHWAFLFYRASSVDALMTLVSEAVAEYSGQLPEGLKAAGRERRAVLQAPEQGA